MGAEGREGGVSETDTSAREVGGSSGCELEG